MHHTAPHPSPSQSRQRSGFPGAVVLEVTYVVSGKNTLRIDYRAETDRPTVIYFTNHAYFNLGGRASVDILEHEMMIVAERFTPVDDHLIRPGTPETS